MHGLMEAMVQSAVENEENEGRGMEEELAEIEGKERSDIQTLGIFSKKKISY